MLLDMIKRLSPETYGSDPGIFRSGGPATEQMPNYYNSSGDPMVTQHPLISLIKAITEQSQQLDPRLVFRNGEGSTTTDYSSTPFGANMMSRYHHPGLVGLNPVMIQDPRFDYSTDISSRPTEGNNTAGFRLKKGDDNIGLTHIANDSPRFTPDLDDKTVANDMWAVTLGGKSGTSPGDQADPIFSRLAKQIVGNAKTITPDHVQQLKQVLIEMRYPDFRQMHRGPGWAPGMDPNTPANPIGWKR